MVPFLISYHVILDHTQWRLGVAEFPYCLAGKFGGVFNSAILRSGKKLPN